MIAASRITPLSMLIPILPEMVSIPAGRFLMGSPMMDLARLPHERQHEVQVAAFDLAIHPVTNAEFRRFRPAHDSGRFECDGADFNGDRQPVVLVSWDDAVAYARWLSSLTGQHYRLSTEAEWECACRAGYAGPFEPGGREHACHSLCSGSETDVDPIQTREVGGGAANPWGVHDMHGNVWEWTASDFSEDYDGAESRQADVGIEESRVVRGGSWNDWLMFQRASARNWKMPYQAWYTIGFRLARDVA